jgi:hypothetical protein
MKQPYALKIDAFSHVTPVKYKAQDLVKLANDEMAELVAKYPDRFVAAIAYLPMNNVDAALRETTCPSTSIPTEPRILRIIRPKRKRNMTPTVYSVGYMIRR